MLTEADRNIADSDFFFRFVTSGRAVAKLPRPSVAAFRLHESQLSVREGSNMMEELKSFQRETNVRVSLLDLLDVLRWRLQNSPVYLWRLSKLRP